MKNFGMMAAFALLGSTAFAVNEGFVVRETVNPEGEVLSRSVIRKTLPSADIKVLNHLPELLAEDLPSNASYYRETFVPAQDGRVEGLEAEVLGREEVPGSEVRHLVSQGDPRNRIDLTIVGDGYTQAQKQRFFDDAQRLTDDLFQGQTFASYLPLFNVHAVFVPSRQSGVTDGSDRRSTALGLYRNPPGSKRAIMPGNRRAIDRAIRLAPDADYPILVANDDFYGGLGGRYAITTRSRTSGSMVLRHELGHNFGNVGEEYDGGQVYSGANFSSSARSVSWQHWVDQSHRGEQNDAEFLDGQYVWQNLRGRPYRTTFDFPAPTTRGAYRFRVKISTVGWATPQDVEARIDGQIVELLGNFTVDRGFLTLAPSFTLAPGRHTLEFTEKVNDGDNVLAFAQLFALPAEYDETVDKTTAYAVFDFRGRKRGYRPTHNGCLMRNMEITEFCAPDKENMWTRFLARVSLIDGVDVQGRDVRVETPALGEKLEVKWFDSQGNELVSNRNERIVRGLAPGRYRVSVELKTAEVRRANRDLLRTQEFQVR
jgi:hypothetical protein